jgi:hypothetical protein
MAGKSQLSNRKEPETVSARVTADEKRWVREQAESLGLAPSAFARQRILGEQLRHADKTHALVRGLSKVGNSLNQLAHVASRSGQVAHLDTLQPVLAQLTDVLRQLSRKQR